MCNYAILMPNNADPNDVLNLTIVHLSNVDATLIKGSSLAAATNMYTVSPGQSFTARGGQNFYLNLVGNNSNYVQFVFAVTFIPVAGSGAA